MRWRKRRFYADYNSFNPPVLGIPAKAKGADPRPPLAIEDPAEARRYSAALAVASFSSFSASAFLPAASSFFSSLFSTRSLIDWFQ
jgi:hypothetical protein